MELQTINQVSKAYGISTRMLRYYEEIGLIRSLRKVDYAYRVYDNTALLRLQQLIVLRKLQIPMKHIRVILNNPHTADVMDIFMQNIRALDGEIKTLSAIRALLVNMFNKLEQSDNIQMDVSLLTDASVLSVVDTLALSKNLLKEAAAMENVASAEVRTIPFGKYVWRVLEEKDGNALIITEYTIEERSYHNELTDITWEHCEMRKYLNSTFYESFTAEEQSRILETQVSDRDNPWTGTQCGNPTTDKVFLLSYDDAVKYFGDSGDLQNRQGWHWVDMDVPGFNSGLPEKGGHDFINDQYNNARRAYKTDGSPAWWWLRSPGGQGRHTTGSIGFIGELFLCGDDVWMHSREHGDEENGGVRPAMWIKL